MFTYKGYSAKVEVDDEAGIIFGTVLDINDAITFQAKTVEQARQEFQNSVDDYLEFCQELGREPERPFSGEVPYLTSPETHQKIFRAAKKAGKTMNVWMDEILSEMADRELEA